MKASDGGQSTLFFLILVGLTCSIVTLAHSVSQQQRLLWRRLYHNDLAMRTSAEAVSRCFKKIAHYNQTLTLLQTQYTALFPTQAVPAVAATLRGLEAAIRTATVLQDALRAKCVFAVDRRLFIASTTRMPLHTAAIPWSIWFTKMKVNLNPINQLRRSVEHTSLTHRKEIILILKEHPRALRQVANSFEAYSSARVHTCGPNCSQVAWEFGALK